jgi:hypothetical protein
MDNNKDEKNYLTRIVFYKQPRSNKYRIKLGRSYNSKEIGFRTPPLKVNFGIERYLNNDIINIEFSNYKNNNKVYNFYSQIKQIDTFLDKLRWNDYIKTTLDSPLSDDFINSIQDKKYLSCIKYRPNKWDPLLRTMLMKTKDTFRTKFYMKDNDKINYIDPYSIKGHYCIFTIKVGNLWISNDKYGLTFYIKSCEVINNSN